MTRPLAILAALTLVVGARAAAPPPAMPERPAPGPLFNADEVHVNPLHLSLAAFGAATPPSTGRWAALGAVYAGEQHRAWNLDGPLTNRHSRVSLGASSLALAGLGPSAGALSALGVLEAGQQLDCWSLIDTDHFRPLPEDWLKVITDNEPIGAGGVEAEVYSRALIRANFTSSKAFKRAARKDVTYAHVYGEPARYRGTVVRVEGRLLRVNRFDPPHEAQEAGVNDVYEAWVFNEQLGTNPYCVLFTEWPAGLPRDLLGEGRIDRVVRVAIDGYFFKRYRYNANDPRGRELDAPLVIGHGLLLLGPAAADDGSATFPIKLVMGVFGAVFGGLIVGVVAVTYWYRRSDRRIRRRILARMPEFALPPPEAAPVAAPVHPTGARPLRRRMNLPAGYPNPTPGELRTPARRDKPPPDEDAGA
ncbi:MAG: hypothetical protein U0797_05715 [Gemmataceae bacterium]